MSRRDHSPTHQGLDMMLLVEVALLVVTVTAIVGMHPLFLGKSFLVPLLFQVIVAHLAVAAFRRTNLSLGFAALLSLVAAVVAISWSQYADTLWLVFPSVDTWTTVWADIGDAWAEGTRIHAPVPVEPGFVAVASVAIWVAVFTADWGALRTGVSFESLLPSATLFLFAATLGLPALEDDRSGIGWSATVYAAAALLFLLVHRTWRQEATAPWADRQRRRGRVFLLSSGTVLAATAVLLSGFAWPYLPGATNAPIVPWPNLDEEDDTRRVVSPLVDVRGQLVERSNLEMFTVQTDDDETGAYWRLTALDEFNGNIWRSSYRTDPAAGPLPQSVDSSAATRQLTQKISITNLEAIWLPAAHEPMAYRSESPTPVEYDNRSSTLIVDRSVDTSDGLTYTVTSDVPMWTAEQLREAGSAPDEIVDRYLQLPDDFNEEVAAEARRITAGQDTDYDKALALVSYLRDFEYTLDPPLPGTRSQHSQDALAWFLFETQRGYCEQFSGAFAAMARSLGIPTRVAVGFTMGVQDPNERTLFRVQGKHAHAWPEVHFEGYGWVPFEPTPGRGVPGGEAWLPGIPTEQVDDQGDGSSSTTLPGGGGPPSSVDEPSEGEGDQDTGASPAPEQAQPTPPPEDGSGGFLDDVVPPEVTAASRPLGIGALGYLVVVPVALLLQRYIRRRRARGPTQQVRLAWEETLEQAALLGVTMAPSLTVNERAERLRLAVPDAAPALAQMAQALERSLYAETTPSPQEAGLARLAANAVRNQVTKQRQWYLRALSYLDARRLLPKSKTVRVRRSAHSSQRSQRTLA